MLSFLFSLIISIVPYTPLEDNFDLLEINHFYDENGKKVFTQAMFCDWSYYHSSYIVQGFRIMRTGNIRMLCKTNNGYKLYLTDNGLFREITCKFFRESWTQYDPEQENRIIYPREERKLLSQETR